MSADELYHQDAEGCLFYTCTICGSNSGTFASLPGFLYCTSTDSNSFWLPICQKSDPKISSTTGTNWGKPRSTAWKLPFPNAFGHSDTLTGGTSKTASLSLEYICSWMSFAAAMRKMLPPKLLQPTQDLSFPLRVTTGHYANSLGKKTPSCTLTVLCIYCF